MSVLLDHVTGPVREGCLDDVVAFFLGDNCL